MYSLNLVVKGLKWRGFACVFVNCCKKILQNRDRRGLIRKRIIFQHRFLGSTQFKMSYLQVLSLALPNMRAPSQFKLEKKTTTHKKISRGLNLWQQLLCAQEAGVLPTAPRVWGKRPTRCACVRVDFQNPKLLLKTRTTISLLWR